MRVLGNPVQRVLLSIATALLYLSSVTYAQAEGEQQYNVFQLSSEASTEVDNDLMIATLAVQDEDKDAAILADKINSSAAWATNVLRPFATISFKTHDYQTYPRYDTSESRRLIGWRGMQTIELETEDFEAAGKAIQKLQEKLQVQSIRLSVKPETRNKASDSLIAEALDMFKSRARLIQKNMNASEFKIVDVELQTGHGNIFASRMNVELDEYSSASGRAEPSIEAGTTRVTVHAIGRIQLQ